jgi:predicted RNA-binding Zn-ribbon protein involved in translation (DUF1610 family)
LVNKIVKPPLERKWYRCPECGKKLVIYDNTAACQGVFLKCRECDKEVEIRIKP